MKRQESQVPSLPVLLLLATWGIGTISFMLAVSAGIAYAEHRAKERSEKSTRAA